MGKILETLIYRDGGGNRRLRDYVKVSLIIFALVIGVVIVGARNRGQMVAQVMATPRPLSTALMPTPTKQLPEPVVPTQECASDPAGWTLVDSLVPNSNLKKLTPECAYEQLEKTAAWMYATSVLGHGRLEAANLLGIPEVPMTYLASGQLTVLTDFNDQPQKADLRTYHNHPLLAEWRIDTNGNPAVALTFSGCFRASSVNGGQVTMWGDGYPVICQFFADYQYKYIVSDINGKILTIDSPLSVRRPTWFGYIGNRNWVWLGSAKNWDVELSQLQERGASTINPNSMAEKYGINFLPLPQDWSSAIGQEFTDAFVAELKTVSQ